jgi:hypothetical protein
MPTPGAPASPNVDFQVSSTLALLCAENLSGHDAIASPVYWVFMMFSSSSGSGKKPPPSQVRAVAPAVSREVPTDITCGLQEMVQVGTCPHSSTET